MDNHLDARDQELLSAIVALRDQLEGPRIGDYVVFGTGELERFSHDWGQDIQTSPGGSFYLCSSGHSSFSGGLNPETPIQDLELTPVLLPGTFWFFHHGHPGAGRGVYFEIPCKVFKTKARYTGYLGADFQSDRIRELKKVLAIQLATAADIK